MIRNVTKKKVLVKEHRVFMSVWSKGLGLMFRLHAPSWAVVFPFFKPQRVSIHMFFVFFSLDILWLDKNLRVLEARTLRPWTLYAPAELASWVVELPAGVIGCSCTKKGDLIEIK